ERERQQAEHLRDRILRDDPKAKLVVHAGYAHISKKIQSWKVGDKTSEIKLMATRFRELTGIDPLSIDQTSMTEHRTPELEHPAYRWAIEHRLLQTRPIIFKSKTDGSAHVPQSFRGTYDVVVYQPRSRYEDGRPDWLLRAGRRQYVVKAELLPAHNT